MSRNSQSEQNKKTIQVNRKFVQHVQSKTVFFKSKKKVSITAIIRLQNEQKTPNQSKTRVYQFQEKSFNMIKTRTLQSAETL